ncbi:ATP-grasp domain-containing protein [Deinococcus sp. YIM 134068]|uniref:ATP-grasp domain-containing protein n=1 Tax=Deinococcus lichenicola TaxID=3118910 RepID=UPI002F921C88
MLLFPAEPFAGQIPDATYMPEVEETRRLGLDHALLDFEALLDGNPRRALRWVPPSDEPRLAVFRGWMMRAEVYATLHEALSERGLTLVNTPEQYRHTHHLPESFGVIERDSPRTVWLPAATVDDVDREAVRTALSDFGTRPGIVKDYVKSRKHEWREACFIPDLSDTAGALRVIDTFLQRQGEAFQGGLVLREFEEFAPLAEHSRSGLPLTREYRLFLLDGAVRTADEYWEEGDYPTADLPLEHFAALGQRVDSHFFTMDVAQREDGMWRVMELGDGQVAGLPERMNVSRFYEALAPLLTPA